MAWEVYQVEGMTRIKAQSMNKLVDGMLDVNGMKENDLLMSKQRLER